MNARQIAETFKSRQTGTYAEMMLGPSKCLMDFLSGLDPEFRAYNETILEGWTLAEATKEIARLKKEGLLRY